MTDTVVGFGGVAVNNMDKIPVLTERTHILVEALGTPTQKLVNTYICVLCR